MTVPSFLRSSGLLLRSATFCFNRDRTFRLGSEAAGAAASASHGSGAPAGAPARAPAPTGFAQREIVPAVVGAEEGEFVGGGSPGAASLGRGTLVQGGVVSPEGRRWKRLGRPGPSAPAWGGVWVLG